VLAREVATAIVADRTTHEPSQRALAAKRLEALGGDPVGGRRARGLVVGRAECLLAGVLAVAFWDGGGPAGQKPERVFGWGTGFGGVEGQHEPGRGWEVHRGVGNFDHADDRMAEVLDPGVVQLDVVRGPAGAELWAVRGEFPDEAGEVAVQRVGPASVRSSATVVFAMSSQSG
jgi:hypothetical protein